MTTLTIRGLSDELRAKLRVRAAHHGRSVEAEVRAILHEAIAAPTEFTGLGTRIHERFADIGGVDDLEPAERAEQPRAAELPA